MNGNGRRGVHLLSALFLGVATLMAVGGLAYQAIVRDIGSAGTTLGLLATSGLAGLLVLAGAKSKEDHNNTDV